MISISESEVSMNAHTSIIPAKKNWWRNEVVYQIYPKSFYDSNNDGIGDLKGIEMKLPYLKELGITMIWICPIFSSPMVDNGYDISDFEGIHPDFGTMADFDSMLAKATELGIKVILDLVINHTSDQHPWFQSAISDPQSPYREFYIFKMDKERPNNWRSIFGGSVWDKLPNEEGYYFHAFDKAQPDLNWESPALREELYAMVNRWLTKGIAGFRIDAITFVKKDQDFSPLPVDGADGLAACKHKIRNRPGIGDFLNELKAKTFTKHNCVTVAEAPGVPFDEYEQYIGENGYFSMMFDFHAAGIDVVSGSDWFKRTNWTVVDYKKKLEESQMALQKAGWGANFIENHDQPRILSKLVREPEFQNEHSAKALGLMHTMLRGTPFIYQGQELGMKNFKRHSIEEFNDISSLDNYYRAIQEGVTPEEALHCVNLRSRDNTRTPFPWDSSQYGGFSTARPWLAMTEEYPTVTAENNSVLDFYKEMIQLRQSSKYSEVLIYGDIEFLPTSSQNLISYKRSHNQSDIYCITNLSPTTEEADVKRNAIDVIIGSEALQGTTPMVTLKPYQSILFTLKKGAQ